MKKLIDESLINVCEEESVSPEKIFFAFLFCWLYRYGLSKHKVLVCERQLIKILGVILVVIKKKNHVEFFGAGVLRV